MQIETIEPVHYSFLKKNQNTYHQKLTELIKQKSWEKTRFELFHFRERDNEVDFILEKVDGSIIGIEVKCTKNINSNDLKGLKYLKSLTKNKVNYSSLKKRDCASYLFKLFGNIINIFMYCIPELTCK